MRKGSRGRAPPATWLRLYVRLAKGSCAGTGPPGILPSFISSNSLLVCGWGNRGKTEPTSNLRLFSPHHRLLPLPAAGVCGSRGRLMVVSTNQGGNFLPATRPQKRSHSQSRTKETFASSIRKHSKIFTHLGQQVVEAGSLSARTTPQDKCLETRSPPTGHTRCPSHQNGC